MGSYGNKTNMGITRNNKMIKESKSKVKVTFREKDNTK